MIDLLVYGIWLIGMIACVGWLLEIRRSNKREWRKVYVSGKGRGGRADDWYWVSPTHEGRELWLTDESVIQGKVRASGLQNHQYFYMDGEVKIPSGNGAPKV